MQYHIQTTPIWDAFKSDCECPLCVIYNKVNSRLVAQYLNEAVMEPDYRIKVNKNGFCVKHLQDLYANQNKLGLALQIHTRTDEIIRSLKTTENCKEAVKLADKVDKLNTTCVICDEIDEMMTRYAYTVAQMYAYEKDFPLLISKGKGFCLPHFSLLLKNADKAGKAKQPYLKEITSLERLQLERLNAETEWFTLKFDYRNKDKPWLNSKDALPRGINKIKGETLQVPPKSGDS